MTKKTPDHINIMNKVIREAEKSPDPSTQNCSIIIDEHGLELSCETNHFPKGVTMTPERLVRPDKYSYIEHTERNAIYAAVRKHHNLNNAIIFTLWMPCAGCARAIVGCGIKKLFCISKRPTVHGGRWLDSVTIGETILNEGGVRIEEIDPEELIKPHLMLAETLITEWPK